MYLKHSVTAIMFCSDTLVRAGTKAREICPFSGELCAPFVLASKRDRSSHVSGAEL